MGHLLRVLQICDVMSDEPVDLAADDHQNEADRECPPNRIEEPNAAVNDPYR